MHSCRLRAGCGKASGFVPIRKKGPNGRVNSNLKDQVESDLPLTVHSFVNTRSKKTLFSNETPVEIGYKSVSSTLQ